MDGAIIYGPHCGMLPILHTMREEARATGDRPMAEAVCLLIMEYISRGDRGEGANRLRRQAIDIYTKAAGLQ